MINNHNHNNHHNHHNIHNMHHSMHHSMHRSNGGNSYVPQYDKIIRPDLLGYRAFLAKLYKLDFFMIPVCMILFMALPMAFGAFGLAFLPFIGFGAFGFIGGISYAKYRAVNSLISVIDQVEAVDKILIRNISFAGKDMLYILKLLMKNDHLRPYEIIEDVMVSRRDLHLKRKDVIEFIMPDKVVIEEQSRSEYCIQCGEPYGKDNNFCAKCGRRLR